MQNPGSPGAAPQPKRIPIVFPDDPGSPTLYVNAIQILIGSNEFVVTVGTVLPPQIQRPEDLDSIDQLTAQPLFRFAVAPPIFKDFIDLMTTMYENAIKQQRDTTIQSSDGKGVRGT